MCVKMIYYCCMMISMFKVRGGGSWCFRTPGRWSRGRASGGTMETIQLLIVWCCTLFLYGTVGHITFKALHKRNCLWSYDKYDTVLFFQHFPTRHEVIRTITLGCLTFFDIRLLRTHPICPSSGAWLWEWGFRPEQGVSYMEWFLGDGFWTTRFYENNICIFATEASLSFIEIPPPMRVVVVGSRIFPDRSWLVRRMNLLQWFEISAGRRYWCVFFLIYLVDLHIYIYFSQGFDV